MHRRESILLTLTASRSGDLILWIASMRASVRNRSEERRVSRQIQFDLAMIVMPEGILGSSSHHHGRRSTKISIEL